jgi:hypothetical protein
MDLEPLQIKVTHSFRASEASFLVTPRYIPEDQNLSKFDIVLSFRNRLGTVRDNYFTYQVVWFSVLSFVAYIVYDAGEVSLCRFFYFRQLRKLTGWLVASHLAIKLLTLSLKACCVYQRFSGAIVIACDLIAHIFLNRTYHYDSLCLFIPVLDLLEPAARTKNRHPSLSVVFHNLFVFWLIFCKICCRILSLFLFQHVLFNCFFIVV